MSKEQFIQKTKTLGKVIDGRFEAINLLEYLNEILECIGLSPDESNDEDYISYKVSKATYNISFLMDAGLEVVKEELNQAKLFRESINRILDMSDKNDAQGLSYI